MGLTALVAFGIIMVLQAFGDAISSATKGRVPSIFAASVLFLIGFWAGMPKDLLAVSGITGVIFNLMLTLLVTHMGSLMKVKELIEQWRTILIGLAGIVGIMIFSYLVGGAIFGREIGVIVAPPLSGGLAATSIMTEAATTQGKPDLALMAVMVFVIQGFFGYPIMSASLRKQSKYLLNLKKEGKLAMPVETEVVETKSRFKIIPEFPPGLRTENIMIAKVAVVAILAEVAGNATGGIVHKFVFCLIFGIVASELGFLEAKILNKAESMGLLMALLMGFVFGGLADATPQTILSMLVPLFGTMIIGILGLLVMGIVVGKLFGETWMMSIAIVINCLCGFPPNYILTKEASRTMAKTDEEYEFLMHMMLPKVLVGGFATVTVASVLVAGIFVNLL